MFTFSFQSMRTPIIITRTYTLQTATAESMRSDVRTRGFLSHVIALREGGRLPAHPQHSTHVVAPPASRRSLSASIRWHGQHASAGASTPRGTPSSGAGTPWGPLRVMPEEHQSLATGVSAGAGVRRLLPRGLLEPASWTPPGSPMALSDRAPTGSKPGQLKPGMQIP